MLPLPPNSNMVVLISTSLAKVEANKPFSAKIVTEILPAKTFYLAEDYHQDYYKKNSYRYRFYRSSCGRDNKIESLWGEVASEDYH
ncbi:peptide-methionine (S)-S-oxide reductase [Marinomonas sp. TI.3.20]|uniref:peptide-methionine (S)-S-oxide reductase n=1 Tax=Marinomonas sp. TI.3.20 TaxID=3121296 RepID=UPI00311FBD4D